MIKYNLIVVDGNAFAINTYVMNAKGGAINGIW